MKKYLKVLTTTVLVLTLALNAFAPAFAATAAKSKTTKVTATKKAKKKAAKKVIKKAPKKVTKKAETKTATTPATATNGNAILSEDFAKSEGKFVVRGSSIKWEDKAGSDGKNGYLMVSDRAAAWNGASVDVTDLVKPGETYTVKGWVKYTDGDAVEKFKITQQKNGSAWPAISGPVEVKKGEWTEITGTMTVEADTTKCEVYFETDTNATISFMCDSFTISK